MSCLLLICVPELKCIEDETHNLCPSCICISKATSPMCYISQKRVNGVAVRMRRGCIQMPSNPLVPAHRQCEDWKDVEVQCCSKQDFCNNITNLTHKDVDEDNSNSLRNYSSSSSSRSWVSTTELSWTRSGAKTSDKGNLCGTGGLALVIWRV